MDIKEKMIEKSLLLIALSSISVLALIAFFIFGEGLPLIWKIGPKAFLFGERWVPSKGEFGILPMIIGSFWVTFGALLLGIPLGLACSIFLCEWAPPLAGTLLRPAIQLLAAIPSVIYGFWGLVVLVPLVRNHLGGPGLSILSGSVILGFMILPTIISISEDSLNAVPNAYVEASLAMGASRWQTLVRVKIPAALSGIIAAFMLGMGRAIGETMTVLMATGNARTFPHGLLQSLRTMTSNIAIELGEVPYYTTHYYALFAIGLVLFLMTFLVNLVADVVLRKYQEREQ